MLGIRRSMTCGMAVGMVVAGSAGAAVTGVTGQGVVVAPPASATFPAIFFSSALVWNERANVTAPPGGFVVNMLVNGGVMSSTAPSGGVVQGNVDSHFIHWSPLFSTSGSGTVTFNAPIVGVMYGDLWLNQSDAALGTPGTSYPSGAAGVGRGMHTTFSQVSVNGNTLRFDFARVSGFGRVEQVRVLTQVPAPSGVCVAGLAMLGSGRRRR
ncbi:MAG: hypothetical protein AB7G17_12220 [Phycisphaerales bacterium]